MVVPPFLGPFATSAHGSALTVRAGSVPEVPRMMTSRERVSAALHGRPVDRPPIAFWGHFYHRESSARALVEATLEFQREYAWDWIKLNPRKHYHVEPWGVSYRYSGVPNQKPVLDRWPVHQPEDWRAITERPADAGAFAEQIEAVRMMRSALSPDVPLIETVFTPLAVLGEMVEHPATLREHIDHSPDLVRAALEAVTRTYERYVSAVLGAGADGIFFATVDWGSRDWLSPEEYAAWAKPYDLRILKQVARAPFNVLHVCKGNNLLLELADYPVQALSWAATDATNPTLAQVLEHSRAAVMGGIAHEGALLNDDPSAALDELRRAHEQTGGGRWLVSPGCSIFPHTPPANLRALRDAVESMMSHGRSP
jgi:uroporphyrinogen decarboxylase